MPVLSSHVSIWLVVGVGGIRVAVGFGVGVAVGVGVVEVACTDVVTGFVVGAGVTVAGIPSPRPITTKSTPTRANTTRLTPLKTIFFIIPFPSMLMRHYETTLCLTSCVL